jgi:hypothetical protein
MAHISVREIIHLLLQVFYFFITDRDFVALPTPPIDEVAVACPLGYNNNDARGEVIYVRAVADSGGGTTHACSSLSSKLMIRVSAICHDLQDVAPP